MINRKNYLDNLILWKDKQVIKVITGIRRCGKSTLFELYKNYLISGGVSKDRILSINFEDPDFDSLTDYKKLYEYIRKFLKPNGMNYIFLDEIQNVKDFQKAVDGLFIKKNIDLYITGSNAHLLSGELATLLSGRYIEIEMLPLSFQEYYNFYKNTTKNTNKKILFNNYLEYGGFPYITELGNNQKAIETYLNGIYDSVLLKDVTAKNKISDVMILESIIKFLFHNVGNFVSTKKIADSLNSNGRKTSVNTVENYLSALINCYMLYIVKRYDIKGKQHLKTLEKYYIVDTGLRNILITSKETDIGHIIENLVYLELLRRGYKISIGMLETFIKNKNNITEKLNLEIDFIAEKSRGIEYYQVCADINSKSTLERELLPLKKIKDNFPKYLITLNETADKTYEGIKQINIIDWLLNENI